MADFDDHNPFRNDDDIVHTIPIPDSPEGSDVDLSSEPSTPPAHPARIPAASGTSPTSPGINRGFTSPPSSAHTQTAFTGRSPQPAFKSDFCCPRDRWLHSGEDVEIQVSVVY